MYLPDARTLVFGSPAEVEAAIDTNGNPPAWEDPDFLQPDYPIITASVGVSPQKESGFNLPAGMTARTQGAGLVLSGNEVGEVTLLKFETVSEAVQFVNASEEAEQQRRNMGATPRGFGEMNFTQHGRTVAVSRGLLGGRMNSPQGNLAAAPLALLARLGKNPKSS